jgi:hypothetical protein
MRDAFEKRLTRVFRARSERTQRRWGCLTETEIAAFADQRVADREKARVESHLDRCLYCREQVAFLADQNQAESLSAVPAEWMARAQALAGSRGRGSVIWRWQWGAAAAAMACVALVIVVTLRVPREKIRSVPEPSTREAPTVRSGENIPSRPELISPVPGATVPAHAVEFRWKPVDGAREYSISVATTAGDLVWEQQTEATTANLPFDVKLVPGQKYFVWIRAYLKEDKAVRSRAVPFIISNP